MNWMNQLGSAEAAELLRSCCGSTRWVTGMLNARPFESAEQFADLATAIWDQSGPQDYLEAFAAHPQIGDKKALQSTFSRDRWAGGEQSGASNATDRVLEDLAEANRLYRTRFGYIFIICATGKSADEMLAALRARLDNPPEVELAVAAGEQARITRLRVAKLVAEHAG